MTAGRLERGFYGLALLLATSAGVPGLTQSAQTTDLQPIEPTPQALWWAVYLVVLVLCARHFGTVAQAVTRNGLVLALCAWALCSIVWSDAPSLTLRRSVALLLTALFGSLLAARLTRGQLFELACAVTAMIVLASAALALLRPGYGLDHLRGGVWRGLFDTKNELGRMAALAAVLWTLRMLVRPRRRLVSAAVAAVALVTILQSGSRTALFVVGTLAVFTAALPALRASREVATSAGMFLLAGLGAVTYWFLHHSGSVVGTVGADSTLTGRTRIWSAVWTMIHRHYWLGWGYNAFWRGLHGPSALVWGIVGSTPPHAHDGYLDVWLDLGVVGVGLVVALLASSLVRCWRTMRAGALVDAWPLAFVLFLTLYNLTESALATRNSLFWMLFVAGVGSCGAAAERAARPVRAALPVGAPA